MRRRFGFTMIELTIAMITSVIVIMAMGVVLVDGQIGWNRLYDSVAGEISTDGLSCQEAFYSVVRKSTVARHRLGSAGEYVEVYYYASPSSIEPDRYANFRISDGKLLVDYGPLDPGTYDAQLPEATVTLSENVSSAYFSSNGTSIEMVLTLTDGDETRTVACSATRQQY